MQHGQQTGGVESHCAARKLWPTCHYWNLMGRIPWLKCGCRWLQAAQKRQVGKEQWRCRPLYQGMEPLCQELSLRNSHEQVKSLWVRIRDWGNKGNLVVGVCYILLTTYLLWLIFTRLMIFCSLAHLGQLAIWELQESHNLWLEPVIIEITFLPKRRGRKGNSVSAGRTASWLNY